MSEENKRIREWLEKFKRFVDESRPLFIKKPTKRPLRARGKKGGVKWYHFRTQDIRREIARGLGELYDIALGFAKNDALERKEREKWSRVAAYIAQTLNSILQTYDVMKIEKSIEELRQFVKLHLGD